MKRYCKKDLDFDKNVVKWVEEDDWFLRSNNNVEDSYQPYRPWFCYFNDFEEKFEVGFPDSGINNAAIYCTFICKL